VELNDFMLPPPAAQRRDGILPEMAGVILIMLMRRTMTIRLNADQLSRIQDAIDSVGQWGRNDVIIAGRHKLALEELAEVIITIVLPEETPDAAKCLPAAAAIRCDDCGQPASFIQYRRAVCYEHRT
jgi:hypothetical protein